MLRENNLGYLPFKATLPTQISSLNKIPFPLPSSHLTRSSNLPPQSFDTHTSFKSFHQRDPDLLGLDTFKLLQPPYLDSKTSFHKPSLEETILQIHFPNRATLNSLILITPRPPASRDSHTFSQEAHASFLPSDPQPHRKSLCNFTIFFTTTEGILNKER